MSAEALAYVWNLDGITAEERLALLWAANSSGGLGHAVMPEFIGLGEFMCCHYSRASDVLHGLSEKGLIRWGDTEETQCYFWIWYGGPLIPPVDWTQETKRRSTRVAALIERDGPKCSYCDKVPVNYHVDHYIPRSKGGRDRMDNLVLACPDCNLAKSGKMPEEFLRDRPELHRRISSSLNCLHDEL